jgi:putative ABC transport system permease protein
MTALALIGLVLGVATIVTLVSVSTGVQGLVKEQTGQVKGIMIMEEGESMGPFYSTVGMDDLRKIEGIAGVRNVCPRVMYFMTSIDGEPVGVMGTGGMAMPGMVFGVSPEREARKRIGPLTTPGEITRGRYLLPSDSRAAVVGVTFADDHNKVVGSSLEIDGVKFRVVGIYETGMQEVDSYVYVPLGEAQDLAGKGHDMVSAAFVELDNPDEINRMADIIEARVNGIKATSTEQFGEMLAGVLANIESFLWVISAIAALVAGINIINTMLMSIMEREQELGVMRAIGWTGEDVIRLVMAESVLTGIGGGLVGLAVGVVMVEIVKAILGIPMLVDAELAVEAVAFAVAVGTLGGAYPAWRASKMDPLMAIRGE